MIRVPVWSALMTMITISQRLDFTGLAPDEVILGGTLTARHRALLSSYLFNLDRGAIAVRDMIVADLRSFLDLGALQRAADSLVVLRLFLFDYPQALSVVFGREKAGNVSLSSNIGHENWRKIPPTSDAGMIPIDAMVSAEVDAVVLPFCRRLSIER